MSTWYNITTIINTAYKTEAVEKRDTFSWKNSQERFSFFVIEFFVFLLINLFIIVVVADLGIMICSLFGWLSPTYLACAHAPTCFDLDAVVVYVCRYVLEVVFRIDYDDNKKNTRTIRKSWILVKNKFKI